MTPMQRFFGFASLALNTGLIFENTLEDPTANTGRICPPRQPAPAWFCGARGFRHMPLTIHAIVCAVDFSPFSPMVIAHGVALARRAGVRLYLLHAVHDPQDGVHPSTVFERGGDLAEFTRNADQKMGELMAATPVDWEPVVCFGDPVEQTAAVVNRLPPSLVVSASHGVSGFRRLFIGTVVERLTRALNRPMLVVKPDAGHAGEAFDGFGQMVVSCDTNDHWHRLAPLQPLLQTAEGTRIHLVHALEGPLANRGREGGAASYNQTQQAQRDYLIQHVRQASQGLFDQAADHAVTVAPGVPQEMVLQVARQEAADLIVVGVRRSGKMGRWISGSTTEALLRHASCCVLTIPEPETGRSSGGQRS
jgi:nucleotide-binding universal stress UspA family protein